MDQGERTPRQESAASIAGRTAAIDAAFAAFPEFESSDDDFTPSAAAADHVENPAGDDQQESASTEEPDQKPGEKPVDESTRPVEGQEASPVANATLEAPKHWPKDRRDQFQTLPDDAKRIILERNKEANVAVTTAQQEAARFRKTHEALNSVFNDDHKAQMRSAGLDEMGAIQYLLSQHDAMNRDPVSFLKAVIARTGVKAEQLYGGQQSAAQNAPGQQQQQPSEDAAAWRDPDVMALEAKLAKLEQIEQERQRQAEEAKRTEKTRHEQWFRQQCDAFEAAMDADGNPKYPHLPAVMKDVVRLINSDPAIAEGLRAKPQEVLEQVYNQALYLNPEIRQKVLDSERQKWREDQEKAAAVKKAKDATTRKGSPGANGQAKVRKNMSVDEAINKAFADAGW